MLLEDENHKVVTPLWQFCAEIDYAAIELRVLSMSSNDESELDSLCNSTRQSLGARKLP